MDIYHGSQFIIENPVFHGGKAYNDYGYGFYCTEYEQMAAEWSVSPEHNGYINHYRINLDQMSVLNLTQYPTMTWLAVLLDNRTFDEDTLLAREAKRYILKEFLIEYENYDIIRGYRADDSYFSFAQDFINGAISYEQLSKAMRLGELGEQIVLKSKRAFEEISWIEAKEASRDMWLSQKEKRDGNARKEYRKMSAEPYKKGALYITRILDEEMKQNDTRLR